ncbi:MAG: twin-arginine translocation signal domain-containing protein, partial [Betaproteobacteria bacterium]|nr:twin-arginine translocation signal domain-containing protein [Betaproteobacteria bacterium]
MITRRTLLKTAAAAAATSVISAPAIGQSSKKITFLTWNIIDQKELIDGWIKRFQSTRPGVEVEWLDKKGPGVRPVLPDPAHGRHAARRDQHARRAGSRVRGAGRAAGPDA